MAIIWGSDYACTPDRSVTCSSSSDMIKHGNFLYFPSLAQQKLMLTPLHHSFGDVHCWQRHLSLCTLALTSGGAVWWFMLMSWWLGRDMRNPNPNDRWQKAKAHGKRSPICTGWAFFLGQQQLSPPSLSTYTLYKLKIIAGPFRKVLWGSSRPIRQCRQALLPFWSSLSVLPLFNYLPHLQWWGHSHLPRQFTSVPNCPYWEEIFPNVS